MAAKKQGFKHWIGRLHLWLGLSSGLIVFIVSITGCLFVFQDEIKDATASYRTVAVEDKPMVPLSVLRDSSLALYPHGTISRYILFKEGRPAVIFLKSGQDLRYLYFNPYSGRLLKDENLRQDFFVIVQFIHMYLLLPVNIGKPIVDVAVIVFVVMLLTGLVLWWPRNKAKRRQSFSIKWGARWRRINYDLHSVMGFYALVIALIIALTGLSMSYEWLRDAFSKTANLGKTYPGDHFTPPVSDTTGHRDSAAASMYRLEQAFEKARGLSPQAEMFLLSPADSSTAANGVIAYAKALNFYHHDEYYFDQYTGELLKGLTHREKSSGAKLADMNYGIHTGQILGLGGKIIAFLASLVSASLPVTGFLLWRGRRKKAKRSKKRSRTKEETAVMV